MLAYSTRGCLQYHMTHFNRTEHIYHHAWAEEKLQSTLQLYCVIQKGIGYLPLYVAQERLALLPLHCMCYSIGIQLETTSACN